MPSVTGAHTEFWKMINGDVMVQLSIFHNALMQSIRQSGLFKEALDEGTAEYSLKAEIVKQEKNITGATISIRYTLTDARLARDIFAEEIETSSDLTEESPLSAQMLNTKVAISRAAFRAAGKNIEVMLARLETFGIGSERN